MITMLPDNLMLIVVLLVGLVISGLFLFVLGYDTYRNWRKKSIFNWALVLVFGFIWGNSFVFSFDGLVKFATSYNRTVVFKPAGCEVLKQGTTPPQLEDLADGRCQIKGVNTPPDVFGDMFVLVIKNHGTIMIKPEYVETS